MSVDSYSLSFDVMVEYIGYEPVMDEDPTSFSEFSDCYTSTSLKELIQNIEKSVQKSLDNAEITESNFDRAVMSIEHLDIRKNGIKIIEIPIVSDRELSDIDISSNFSYVNYRKALFSGVSKQLEKEFYDSIPDVDKRRMSGFDLEDGLGL